MTTCPVCQGRRKVTLRLYGPMRVISHEARVPDTSAVTSKDYPCPECAPTTGEEKVALLEFGASLQSRDMDDPGYIDYARRHIADQLAHAFVDRRLIRFVVDQPVRSPFEDSRITGTIGVVSPNVVASMQERITAHQSKVASEMAEAAAAEVRIWGSHYTGGEGGISKDQAVDAIYRALKRVQEGLS